MRMSSTIFMCKQPQYPLLGIHNSSRINTRVLGLRPPKEKVVVVMGATGTGKSRLSIDLANWLPTEIVNSDKMQVYEGLEIATNKITEEESRGVPHHLLGVIDPNSDFTAKNFCNMASLSLKSIVNRGKIPIIVGGSNSYIEALVDDKNEDCKFSSRYDCCFLWVDVSMPVLHSFVSERVDRMVHAGMVDEVRNMFDPNYSDYSRGIRRAIGVPEFDHYFRTERFSDKQTRDRHLQEAIQAIKDNTCKLACRQLEKIYRLRNVKGWKVHRLDATDVFRKRGKLEADKAWERLVSGPSSVIVGRFLYNFGSHEDDSCASSRTSSIIRAPAPLEKAMAAATH